MKNVIAKKIPSIYTIEKIELPYPGKIILSNGVPLYILRSGTQPVIRFDLVFLAGRPFEKKKLAAGSCAGLLKEGTRLKSSHTIAEMIDQMGASVSVPFSFDHIQLSAYCLEKHFSKLLPVLAEIVQEPIFPEAELEQFIKRSIQRLEIDIAHNDIYAYRKATEMFFGADHPYGYNSTAQLFQDISVPDVKDHYDRLFCTNNLHAFISGQPTDHVIKEIDQLFGSWSNKGINPEPYLPKRGVSEKIYNEQRNKKKSAIRIGLRTFDRNHPDFPGLFVLNTLLGGYFGSRLMQNIREEKGLTYHIHSSLEALQYDGYFNIATETDSSKTNVALQEIWKEINILQEEKVSKKELLMVHNYLNGYLLSQLDGPFQTMDVIKMGILESGNPEYLLALFDQIRETTPDDVQRLANQYLKMEDMYQVVIS